MRIVGTLVGILLELHATQFKAMEYKDPMERKMMEQAKAQGVDEWQLPAMPGGMAHKGVNTKCARPSPPSQERSL